MVTTNCYATLSTQDTRCAAVRYAQQSHGEGFMAVPSVVQPFFVTTHVEGVSTPVSVRCAPLNGLWRRHRDSLHTDQASAVQRPEGL